MRANAALRWLDVIVYLAFVAFVAVSGVRTTLWVVGLCLSAVAAVPWFVARWQLGASFSVRPEARRLVTSGLYSKLRHPVYVFGSLSWFGAVMALVGWQAVIIWLVVVPIQIVRARREERLLAETFGTEFAAYRESSWF